MLLREFDKVNFVDDLYKFFLSHRLFILHDILMQLFFSSLHEIEQYTSWMDRQYNLACHHCQQVGYLVAHGFVYHHVSSLKKDIVGKRFVCSKRYSNQGCGRTIQLRLAKQLPNRRYQALVFGMFILLILANYSVIRAYRQATKQLSTRHAWRWLKALKNNLWRYRQFLLPNPFDQPEYLKYKHPIYLALYRSQPKEKEQICLQFQLTYQLAFIA